MVAGGDCHALEAVMLLGRVTLLVVARGDSSAQSDPAFYVAIVYLPHMLYQHTCLCSTCVSYSVVCAQQPVAYYFL